MRFEARILPLLGILLGICLAIYTGLTQRGFSRLSWLGFAFTWTSLAWLLLWLGWDLLCSRNGDRSVQATFRGEHRQTAASKVIAYAFAGTFGMLAVCSLWWVASVALNAVIYSTSAVDSIWNFLSLIYVSLTLLVSPLCGIHYVLTAALILGAAVGGLVGLCKAISSTES